MRGWMVMAAMLVACDTPTDGDTGAPQGDPAQLEMSLVGTWQASDRLPWQTRWWCPETYQNGWDYIIRDADPEDIPRLVGVTCTQTIRFDADGSAEWTVAVSPLNVEERSDVAWEELGFSEYSDLHIEVDGVRWVIQYEDDPGATLHVYAHAGWFELRP